MGGFMTAFLRSLKKGLFLGILILGLNGNLLAKTSKGNPKVLLKTTMGDITLELDSKKAPITVKNFLAYVKKGTYEGTVFHRVIDNFMVQGGGLDKDLKPKANMKPIKNEADNGLLNESGTVAMARTSDPHSATNQFFINVSNNTFLNHKAKNQAGYGYAVFGKVIKGMSIVNRMKKVKTGNSGYHANVPVNPIIIKKATLL